MPTSSAFIDAANLFYGGEKSLGWKIDYQKLLAYLREKYLVQEIYYFGGIEIDRFPYDYLENDSVPLAELKIYLVSLLEQQSIQISKRRTTSLQHALRRLHFYQALEEFGYKLILKPIKIFKGISGPMAKKANCDVDLTFHVLRQWQDLDRIVILSSDGDFLPILKFLRKEGKEVIVLARGNRMAREIKQFAGSDLNDFGLLEDHLKVSDDEGVT